MLAIPAVHPHPASTTSPLFHPDSGQTGNRHAVPSTVMSDKRDGWQHCWLLLLPEAMGQEVCVLAYWLMTTVAVSRSNLQSNQTCPASVRNMNVVVIYTHCWSLSRLPSNGNIAASSKVNPLSWDAYLINMQLMCNPTNNPMTGSLVMSWICVMHVTWLDLE